MDPSLPQFEDELSKTGLQLADFNFDAYFGEHGDDSNKDSEGHANQSDSEVTKHETQNQKQCNINAEKLVYYTMLKPGECKVQFEEVTPT